MTTATYQALSDAERREVRMFGCTVAQMREAVDESLTVRFGSPALYAISLMSDCQEMLGHGVPDANTVEDVRQALNRAKWILSSHYPITRA